VSRRGRGCTPLVFAPPGKGGGGGDEKKGGEGEKRGGGGGGGGGGTRWRQVAKHPTSRLVPPLSCRTYLPMRRCYLIMTPFRTQTSYHGKNVHLLLTHQAKTSPLMSSPGIISQPTSSIPPLTACRTLVDSLAQPSLDTYYLVRRLGPHPPCTGPRRPIGRKRSGRLTRSWRHCLLQRRWSMKPVLSPARRRCTASVTRLSISPTQARARPKGPCFHRANNCFCRHLSRTRLQCVAIGLARGRGGQVG